MGLTVNVLKSIYVARKDPLPIEIQGKFLELVSRTEVLGAREEEQAQMGEQCSGQMFPTLAQQNATSHQRAEDRIKRLCSLSLRPAYQIKTCHDLRCAFMSYLAIGATNP